MSSISLIVLESATTFTGVFLNASLPTFTTVKPLIYSGTNDITELNYAGPRYAAVRTTKPNALGIYDMSGNVAEWCWDLAGQGRVATSASDITTSTPITGPASVTNNPTSRVLRGGATYEVAGTSSNYYNMAITKADKLGAESFAKNSGFRLFRTDTE